MTSDRLEFLESRIGRIEKQNRLLRAGFLVTALIIVCALTMGQSRASKTIEAQRFLLLSSTGEVRAELGTLDGDYPKLSMKSPNGEKEIALSPLGVSVFDHGLSGKLPLAHYGNTGLYLTDSHGRRVMELGGASVVGPQLAPIPQITIFDEKGQAVWRAP